MTPSPHPDPLELLTPSEVAAITKQHRATVDRDIAAGRLAAVRLGRLVRIRRVDVERYVAEGVERGSSA